LPYRDVPRIHILIDRGTGYLHLFASAGMADTCIMA
jgi:hypothetical protein